MQYDDNQEEKKEFSNILHYIIIIILNVLFISVTILIHIDMITMNFDPLLMIFFSLLLVVLIVLFNLMAIFLWGRYIPKRMIFLKDSIIVQFISPSKKDIVLLRQNIHSTESTTIFGNNLFRRSAMAVYYPPKVFVLVGVPYRVISHIKNEVFV